MTCIWASRRNGLDFSALPVMSAVCSVHRVGLPGVGLVGRPNLWGWRIAGWRVHGWQVRRARSSPMPSPPNEAIQACSLVADALTYPASSSASAALRTKSTPGNIHE